MHFIQDFQFHFIILELFETKLRVPRRHDLWSETEVVDEPQAYGEQLTVTKENELENSVWNVIWSRLLHMLQ